MRRFSILMFCLLSFMIHCQTHDEGVLLVEYYKNGKEKIKVFKPNANGQNRVLTFDEKGQVLYEYFKKGGIHDSLITTYLEGHKSMTMEIGENGEANGKVEKFDPSGYKKEEFRIKNESDDGWHVFFNKAGDTTQIDYKLEEVVYYTATPMVSNGSKRWIKYYYPKIDFPCDSTPTGKELKGLVSIPLPDSLFKLPKLRIEGFYLDQNSISLSDSMIYVDLNSPQFVIKKLPHVFKFTQRKKGRYSILLQTIYSDSGEIIKSPFVSMWKEIVVY